MKQYPIAVRAFACLGAVSLIVGCASPQIVIAPTTTIKRGDAIQIELMSRDPLGAAPRLGSALSARGFDVRDGSVNTNAPYTMRLTYVVSNDYANATCTLVNRSTGRVEATYTISGAFRGSTALDGCADAAVAATR